MTTNLSPGPGRRTLLTPDVQAAICGAVALGQPIRYAAAGCGVGYSTVLAWQREGEADLAADRDTALSAFALALAQARGTRVHRWLEAIQRAANEPNDRGVIDPRPAQWLLERCEPRDFAPLQKIEAEVTAPTTNAKAELAALLEKLVEPKAGA